MAPRTNEIDRKAAEWVAKTDGTTPSAEELRALDAWLAEDPRHLGAYLRAKTVLARVERHRVALMGSDRAFPTKPRWPSRRFILTGTVAASIAALVVTFGWRSQLEQPSSFATNIGERRVIALADGSSVTLNTDSRIIVRYARDRRSIAIEHGEAVFDVAKNKARPFVVTARGVDVRAVGTSFAVRTLQNQPLQIMVVEGVVRLEGQLTAPVSELKANAVATVFSPDRVAIRELTPAEMSQDLAWREGRIVFHHQTLAAVALEFQRYNKTKIVIDDPAVARLTVTGAYTSTDPVGFAKAAALVLDLDAAVHRNGVWLSQKKH